MHEQETTISYKKFFSNDWHRDVFVRQITQTPEYLQFESDSPLLVKEGDQEKTFPFATKVFMFLDKWFNVFVFYNGDGSVHSAYCNIGTPPEIQDKSVSFVDLDLDVVVYPDHSFQVLDEDEFEENKHKYPADYIEKALAATEEIKNLAQNKHFPFNWTN